MKTKRQWILLMKTRILKFLVLLSSTSTLAVAQTTISFDNASLWTSGSGIISSYEVDHVYNDADWTFTGGEALRQFMGTQDGFDRTNSGDYAWRLRDNSNVVWTATHDTCGIITSFGFAVRRWDSSPSPDFEIAYSTNGGSSYIAIDTIDNVFLSNSSAYNTFSYNISSGNQVFTAPNEFAVRLRSLGTTERIMIDDFTFSKVTSVSEASNVASSPVIGDSTTLSWTNPSQFTNMVVVGSQAAITMNPGDCVDPSSWSFSSDWSSPVSVSSQLGSGSSSEYVLYVGSGSSVTIHNLPSGGAINYAVYTQLNPWSAGVLGSTSPLPVELIAFDATKESNYVRLDWVTASELNNNYFEILKSNNGAHFESIGRVAGIGISQQTNRYSFTDFDAKNSTFYKLKQVDYDGKTSYSEVIHIESQDADIKVDILSSEIKINNQSSETASYLLMNSKGILFLKGTMDTHQVIDKSSLPNGCYVLQIAGKTLQTYKFVVLQ